MKAIFPFIIPTDIKVDLNGVTILQGKGKHCTIGMFFVMFAIKSSGTMRDAFSWFSRHLPIKIEENNILPQ